MIVLNLPYPPSVNHLYARQAGRTYLKPAAKAFRAAVANVVTLAAGFAKPQWFAQGALACRVVLNAAPSKPADCDNAGKVLLDALTKAGAWTDDSQVKLLIFQVGEPVKDGRCTVSIEYLEKVSFCFE